MMRPSLQPYRLHACVLLQVKQQQLQSQLVTLVITALQPHPKASLAQYFAFVRPIALLFVLLRIAGMKSFKLHGVKFFYTV